MKLVLNIVAVVLFLIGALWVLQGTNVMPNTAMSGQGTWLWAGVVVAIVGIALGIWNNRRR